MPATVTIRRWTGTSGAPVKTDITSANTVANAQDAHEESASASVNPIKIPTSGLSYSYWVSTRLSIDVAPSGVVDNIRWHTDGSNNFGTGVGCQATTASGYTQATGDLGASGTILNITNYPQINDAALADAFSYTSGGSLAVAGSASEIGDLGDFVVYQLNVGPTAVAGPTSQETFTWLYDET